MLIKMQSEERVAPMYCTPEMNLLNKKGFMKLYQVLAHSR